MQDVEDDHDILCWMLTMRRMLTKFCELDVDLDTETALMNVFGYLFITVYFQDDGDDHDSKLDLEDVLDLDTDSERHQYAIVSRNLHDEDDHDSKLDLEDVLDLDTD